MIYKKWWALVIAAVFSLTLIGCVSPFPDNNFNSSSNASSSKKDNYYSVGEAVDLNGLRISFLAAEKWESDSKLLQPKDGYMYIRLKFSAENTSDVDQYFFPYDFTCYADNKKVSDPFCGDERMESGAISSGRIIDGYLYYSVPVNAKSIEAEYKISLFTDDKIIFIVDLAD